MAAATTDPPVSKSRRRHPDLLFEWVGNRGHRWRLLLFLNMSLALHVACFYAFKVVYPPAVRQRAETTKVTFLDPRDDPGVRDVIRRIEGRAVFFDGSLRLTIPGASLDEEKNQVVPTPGFASHEPSLRSPDEINFSPELPGVFAAEDVFLPSSSRFLPGGKPAARPEPFKGPYLYRPQLVPEGKLADLEIVASPDWSSSQKALSAALGNHVVRFLIEVDEAGEIANCLPWKGVETGFDAAMARQLEIGLKFAPSEGVSRGWLEVRW